MKRVGDSLGEALGVSDADPGLLEYWSAGDCALLGLRLELRLFVPLVLDSSWDLVSFFLMSLRLNDAGVGGLARSGFLEREGLDIVLVGTVCYLWRG